ncbi:MAG: XdhC family protein [Ferruginibacter sp.]
MKKQLQNWQLAKYSLKNCIPVILMYVLESRGSSPGRQGFFMIVNANGAMSGSLGGGIMEHKFVEMAKAKLSADILNAGLYKQVHDKSAVKNQSGMICSGEQTIFLYVLVQQDLPVLIELTSSLEKNENGMLELRPGGIQFSLTVPIVNFFFEQNDEQNFIYREKTGYKNILHIVGGGHCALALSKIMSDMDFCIHIYDDRPNLHTIQSNNFVHGKHELSSYNELEIETGNNVYVVIMTFGYRTDDLAVRALKNNNYRYLGLLGSNKKIEKMMNEYRAEGIDSGWLAGIHSPIGISIKSETPEEIATSIAAEIIREKNAAAL